MKRAARSRWTRVIARVTAGLIVIGTAVSWYAHTHHTPELPSPPLKDLAAQHGVELGNFAILTQINDSRYSDILTSQFNLALIDNTPNWYFTDGGLRPTRDTYNFAQMDKVVAYAQSHHMDMQAHHLLWGEQKWLPDWLKNGNYTHEQLMQIIHDHISTVAGRYKGTIKEWTVANEVFTRGQHLYGLHDWWADHTGGTSYVDQAFIWAHEADPSAKLILNDFGDESPNAVSDAMHTYVRDAKARGIPIDGIGMQMHLDGTHPPKKDDVVRNMQRFAALGVDVYVTEFDVNMNDVRVSNATKDQLAARMYYDMMRACIESKVCHSFSELGITDKETWYNYMPGIGNARPLMFDRNYYPKPAFDAFRNALQQE